MCNQLVQADIFLEAEKQLAAERVDDSDSELDEMPHDTGFSIPAIHLAYNAIRGRLDLFSQLAQSWPQCVEKLSGTQSSTGLVFAFLYWIFIYNNIFNILSIQ